MSVSAEFIQSYGLNLQLEREQTMGTDLTKTVYGSTIPLSQGKRKVAGAAIWASAVRDVTSNNPIVATLEQMFVITKFRDFAVAFGYNLAPEGSHGAPSVLRMWLNGALAYDATDPSINPFPGLTWTLYPGDSTQAIDTTIQADQGDLTPAYRPMIYMVFKNWELPTHGLAPAYDYNLPVVQVEFADGLTISNLDTDFTMLAGSSLTVENLQADIPNGLLYTLSGVTTSAATLHTFDIASKTELSAQAITGSYTNLEGFDTAVAFDNLQGHIVLHSNGVQNTTPVVAIDVNTGAISGTFGTASSATTPRDVDGNDARTSGKPIVTIPWSTASDICYIKVGGTVIPVAVKGSNFKDVDLIPLNADGSFPSSIPVAADMHFTGSGHITFIKRLGLVEKGKTAGAFQDGAALVGVDNLLYCLFFGQRDGVVRFLGSQLVHTFPTGEQVLDAVVDTDDGVVCIHRDSTLAVYKATKFIGLFRVIDAGSEAFFTAGQTWQGLYPAINFQYARGDALQPPDTPLYDVVIPAIGVGNVNRNATKMSFQDGTIAYPSSGSMTVLKLANGSTTTVAQPAHFIDFIWDGRTRTIYHQDTLTHAMAAEQINAAETTPNTIGDFLLWLALRAGYASGDVVIDSNLTDPVLGMLLTKAFDAAQLFTDLGKIYDFYYFESGGKVHFSKVGRGVDVPDAAYDLQVDELAFVSESSLTPDDCLITTIEPPATQTAALTLSYLDSERGYEVGSQTYSLDKQTSDTVAAATTSISLPVVMTGAEAYQRVTKVSIAAVENDITQQFRLPQRYSRLEPSDLIAITKAPYRYIVRLDEVTFNGDKSLSLAGKNFAFDDHITIPADTNLGLTDDGHGFGTDDAKPVVLDIPLLDRTLNPAAGLVVVQTAVETYGQTGFHGTSLVAGPVEGPAVPVYFTATDAKYGVVIGALPDNPSPWCTDSVTELTIALRSGTAADLFESISYADYVAGKNAVLVGAPGRWELVFFKDVTIVNPKVVKLTNLARGRRGTDPNIGLHTTGEQAILIASPAAGFTPAMVTQTYTAPGQLGDVVRYSCSAPNTTRDPAVFDLTVVGNSAKPFTVAQVSMVDAGSDARTIAWMRRDRIGQEFVTVDQPLSEATESYDLEIYDGSTLVRTVAALTSPSYTYSAADQVTDGFTTPLNTLKVRIYQNSAVVGRGFMKEETLDVE